LPPDPEEMSTVLAIVAGAGTSGAVSGLLKGVLPNVAPDIAGAIVGGALYYFGGRWHKLLKAYGVGVLAGSLKGTIEKAIPTIGGVAASPPAQSSPTGNPYSPTLIAAQMHLANLRRGG